jgi:hypothetical protein
MALVRSIRASARKLVRVVLSRVGDRLEMVGVALLLTAPEELICGKTVTDENAFVVGAQHVHDYVPSSRLVDAIESELGVGEDPEPVPGSANPPAGLVGVHHGALANQRRQLLIRRHQPFREPGLQVDQASRRELQGEVLVEHGARLRRGDAQALVQVRRERRRARPDLHTGGTRRQRYLPRVRRANRPAVGAGSPIRHDFRDCGANRRNVLDGLLDGADVGHTPAAVRAPRQRRLDPLIDLLRNRPTRSRVTRATPRLLWRFGAETIPATKWRGLSKRLPANCLDLLLELRLLFSELLVLQLQFGDSPPQALDLVIRRR